MGLWRLHNIHCWNNCFIQELLAKLPAKVKSRVSALKGLQVKSIEIEAAFYKKVHELEKQFEAEFGAVNEARRKIVAGEYEPTAEEATRPLIHGSTEEEIKELNEKSDADNVSVVSFTVLL